MDGNPESPTPETPNSGGLSSEREKSSSVLQESDKPDSPLTESEISGFAPPEYEMSGSNTPEYNLPSSEPTEGKSHECNEPSKQTSTDLKTSCEKKEQKTVNSFTNKVNSFTQLQTIKKTILHNLNRKMNSDLNFTKDETTLTYPTEGLIPLDPVDNESPQSTIQSTGEALDSCATEANVTEEQYHRQKDGDGSEGIELVPGNALNFSNKKKRIKKEEFSKDTNQSTGETLDSCATEADVNEVQYHQQSDADGSEGIELVPGNAFNFSNKKEPMKKSRIPTKVKPKTPENLSKAKIFKKSKIPAKVITVKPINPEKPLKQIELKKSKIPTRIIKESCKTTEKAVKEPSFKKSRIPTKVVKVRPITQEKPLKQIELKKSRIPTRIIRESCKTTEKTVKETSIKTSKIPTKVVKVRPINQQKPLKQIELKKSKIRLESSSPIAEMILNDIEFGALALPININNPADLLGQSQLPVVVKDSESTVTVATLVDVKVSRLPNKLRALFKKLRRPNRKISKRKDSKEKKVKSNWRTDDIYKKALSGDNGMKSRIPMPIRVTHPGKTYPPLSGIPLAFSRFPNPAKVRKVTLLRRVEKAFKKQVAKISWSPKLTFPNMESFFHRIRGSNKVMPVNA